jgi:GT2 family glycosyltransferase
MITVIFSTRKTNPNFIEQITKSSELKDVQVIEVVNNRDYSLSEVYNRLFDEAKYDICVAIHDDIILETGWGKKLLKDFKNNPEFAILGKAGSLIMEESGIYWQKLSTHMLGHVTHQIGDKPKYLSSYSSKFEKPIEVVTIDGLFMAFNKTKVKHKFDTYFNGFHFYDHGFCIPNYISGVKIGVTFSFEITHKSAGETNDEFEYNRLKFIKKYHESLPLEVENKEIIVRTKNPIIKENKQELISIIIPHIHNNKLLFTNIDSLLKSTTYKNFEILVADTGSSEETKQEIKDKYQSDSRIKVIEYDYYKFTSINNDVVKNHISKDSKYILFLNNDIEFLENNDVISRLYEVLISKNNIFGVGARMYFGLNKPLQHAGMFAYIKNTENRFEITHHGINTYYSHSVQNTPMIGNTAACLLVRRNVFEKIGMFNENYVECFDDVELNMKAIVEGYINVFVPDAVCLHKESQTRKNDPKMLEKLRKDYETNLAPFVQKNFDKIKQYIYRI